MGTRTVRAVMVAVIAVGISIPSMQASTGASAGGYNDPACRASVDHPNPVVLLHGLGAPPGSNFSYLGPELAADGYCAFAIDYGSTAPINFPGGFAPMDDSAAQIRAFIADVRMITGAVEVDLVGHSEGGLHSLYVPKKFALGDEIGRVVALAPPTHGTDGSGLLTIARSPGVAGLATTITDLFGCTACEEIAISEDFIEKLNDGPITVSGIDYTIIASRYDFVVTPTETAFVDEPGVTNLVVQDTCPSDPVGHAGLAFDPSVRDMITNALDPDHAGPVGCRYGLPL